MKKAIKTLCVAAIAMFAIPQHADAQFFKKLKEAAANVVKETITGETTTESTTAATKETAPAVNFVTSASGVSVGNLAASHFDLEFVEAVGNKASNTVTIYVKATAKDLNYSQAYIGGRNDGKAYDADGNEYKTGSYGDAKALTVGIPVKYEFAKFERVPATVNKLLIVYGGWYLDANSRSTSGLNFTKEAIQLKNVPITWE